MAILLGLFQISLAQDSATTKPPMFQKLDSGTDSITAVGESSAKVHPDSIKTYIDNSFPVAGYIIIAIIIGAVFTTVFGSLGRKKDIEFKKWNLKNRDKLKNNK